jgi:hypothetical protein
MDKRSDDPEWLRILDELIVLDILREKQEEKKDGNEDGSVRAILVPDGTNPGTGQGGQGAVDNGKEASKPRAQPRRKHAKRELEFRDDPMPIAYARSAIG